MTAAPEVTGGEPAWRSFIGGVRGFVARRVPAADADDVAQEVFVRLHEGAGQLREAAHAQAWTYTIARRTIADYYRRRRGPEPTDGVVVDGAAGSATAGGPPGDPSADPIAHEMVLSWLRPLAESLPEAYRVPLILADFEGHTQAEVAERLGLSLSGAKSRVQRARAMLAEQLHDCCAFELDAGGRVARYERRADECAACRRPSPRRPTGGGPTAGRREDR